MKPSIFRELTFQAAQAAAIAEKKWLLLDFTAEWCAPCQHMDSTTWRESSVVEWINANAVAIQIDVDHDITAKKFGVRSMPTFVVLEGEKELDRSSGGRPATKLLEWLDGLRGGKTELDKYRDAAKTSLQGRLQLSQALSARGKHDEAAAEALWLWDHALESDPEWSGVRLSFLVGHFRDLLPESKALKTGLMQRRDALLPRVKGAKPVQEEIRDFTALNDALDDADSTLQWFDAVKSRGAELALDEDRGLQEVLQQEGRWEDLGKLYRDPVKRLQADFELVKEVLVDLPRGMNPESVIDGFRGDAAMLVHSLHEAGRSSDEAAVRAKATELDPSPEMKQALDGGYLEGAS
jgi:thioredoxin 1